MLTEMKSRYNGKCVKCNRELKEGWDIFYDKETKKVYCTKCGKESGSSASAGLIKTFGLSGDCSNCGRPITSLDESYYSQDDQKFLCSDCGTIASSPKADMQLISAKLEKKFEEISGNNKLIAELLALLDEQMKEVQHNLSLLIARTLVPKEQGKPAKVMPETKE